MNEIANSLQQKIDAVNRAKEEAAYSVINLGRELIPLKKITPHGHFTKLVEWRFGFKRVQQSKYIKIAKTFGLRLSWNSPDFISLDSIKPILQQFIEWNRCYKTNAYTA